VKEFIADWIVIIFAFTLLIQSAFKAFVDHQVFLSALGFALSILLFRSTHR